jgi:hypothetical protein
MPLADEHTDPFIELPEPENERRLEVRYRCSKPRVCRVIVRPSFRNVPALLHDVSSSGVGLILVDRLEPGSILALQLPRVREGMSCVQSARVVHIHPDGQGAWLHGCALSRPLSNEEIAVLI